MPFSVAQKTTTTTMGKKLKLHTDPHKDIVLESYEHTDQKRKNNPSVGLVNSKTDKIEGRTKYAYDPHIDPSLQWAGKDERSVFDVPNISLHVHERIDPKTIAKSFIKEKERSIQPSLFDTDRDVPLSKAVHFYSHDEQWANRLIAGDSLLVMNSLLYKEGMAGKFQMVYIDPPYGIKYNSNFQPFTNKRDVKDGNDADIPAEPEMIKAFRDTWELGIHSYLTYLRDRLLLAREMLNETGSCFVQISDDNLHLLRSILDEVFGKDNFVSQIAFTKAAAGLESANRVGSRLDYILWYAKDVKKMKYRTIFEQRNDPISEGFTSIELPDGTRRSLTLEEKKNIKSVPKGARFYSTVLMTKPGPGSKFEVEYNGKKYNSGSRWWGTTPEGIQKIIDAGRISQTEGSIRFIKYYDDFPYKTLSNLWDGLGGAANPIYVVQTSTEAVARCMLMTTDPGDLVFDPTCGSGTTAYVSEEWGRRWITCDTSRVAITLAKQRLMTANFDFYRLAHPDEGIRSGFEYKIASRITMGSIANNEPPSQEVLYNQPLVEKAVVRSTGPFTMEAVPSVRVKPFDGQLPDTLREVDLAKSGDTALYQKWIDELKTTGIRAVGGQFIQFSRIAHKEGSSYLQAEGDVMDGENIAKANIFFGGEYGPVDQIAVEKAIEETINEKEKARYLIFCAFQFDPEASKDIDSAKTHLEDQFGITVLKTQMNIDLLTEDLRKKRSSNQSYWLIGQPAIDVLKVDGKYQIKVKGFDYYNPATGEMDSRGIEHIAMWMLDTDYDERSVFPTQVFFPQADSKRDWTKLAKALNGTVDQELLEFFSSDTSLPFKSGLNRKIAVKIIDNRGIESLVIKELN